MPLVPFSDLMSAAEAGGFAVGYFESWNLESLLAVADAAEAARSPVILGFSGIYVPHPRRAAKDPLAVYAAMGRAVCERLSVPACLLFNESPHEAWVLDAIDRGFNLVMFSDEDLIASEQEAVVTRIALCAHDAGVAVEGEVAALPGVGGQLDRQPGSLNLSDVDQAAGFVERTGVDALAVNVGQVHLHGRSSVGLDFHRLAELRRAVRVPLVLHGASSIREVDLKRAVAGGIRKVNVGSVLKQTFFRAMVQAAGNVGAASNPYEVIGSGLAQDVLTAGRLAMQREVQRWMMLLGSARQAEQTQVAS